MPQAVKASANTNTPFDVTPDGRFLEVRVQPDANVLDRIDVVLSWSAQLQRK